MSDGNRSHTFGVYKSIEQAKSASEADQPRSESKPKALEISGATSGQPSTPLFVQPVVSTSASGFGTFGTLSTSSGFNYTTKHQEFNIATTDCDSSVKSTSAGTFGASESQHSTAGQPAVFTSTGGKKVPSTISAFGSATSSAFSCSSSALSAPDPGKSAAKHQPISCTDTLIKGDQPKSEKTNQPAIKEYQCKQQEEFHVEQHYYVKGSRTVTKTIEALCNATVSAFGLPVEAAAATNPGTSIAKYQPTIGTDTLVKDSHVRSVTTKQHCITAMKEYERKSLEELRLEDYLAKRKSPRSGNTGGFRFATNTHPATGTGLFGTTSVPSAGKSGQVTDEIPDNKSLFGSTASALGKPATTGFEITVCQPFGDKPSGVTSFGTMVTDNSLPFGTKPAFCEAAAQSLFGQTTVTTAGPAFGATISGFGFGTTTLPANRLFRGKSRPSACVFGQKDDRTTQNKGKGTFGGTAGQPSISTSIFESTTAANPGTSIAKYQPTIGTDTLVKGIHVRSVNTKQHCITAMKEYEGKSLEELRMEDYLVNRKGPQSGATDVFRFETTTHPATGTGSFKTTSLPSAKMFGQTAAETSDNKGLFESNTSAFGKPATTGFETTLFHPFGDKPFGVTSFGAMATDNSLPFGTKPAFGEAAEKSLLGQAIATTAAPAFGATITGFGFGTTTQPATGIFGCTSQPSAAIFGQKDDRMIQNRGKGTFGSIAGQPSTLSFNRHAGSTRASGLGKFDNALSTRSTAANPGTSIAKYQPTIVTESDLAISVNAKQHYIAAMEEYEGKSLESSLAFSVNNKQQCITAMEEYKGKSLEELRVEDYLANRKGPQPRATGGFRFETTTHPATGTGSFKTTSLPSAKMFGQTAADASDNKGLFGSNTSAFGKPATTGFETTVFHPFGDKPFGVTSFGATATDNSLAFGTKPAFGKAAPQSLFGQTTATTAGPAFGATISGFSFGTTTQPATGLFRGKSLPSAGVFGQKDDRTTQNNGKGTFGGIAGQPSTSTSIFESTTAANPGTSITKYQPTIGTDTLVRGSHVRSVNTKQHCITAMEEYKGKSLEELRMEDYLVNRKGPQCGATDGFRFATTTLPATSTDLFGTTSLPSAGMFGQAAADASDNKGLFGSNTSAFGKPATTGFETTVFHPFGDKPFGVASFGATATDNSLPFGTKPAFGEAAAKSLFGQAIATTAAPAFGATITGFSFGTTTQPATGIFGCTSQPSAAIFGQKDDRTIQNRGKGTFGSIAGQPSTLSFNQHAGSTSASGLGKFDNALSTRSTAANPGTSIAKYQPPIVTESGLAISVNAKQHYIAAMEEYEGKSLESSLAFSVNSKQQCITAMEEYKGKSLEELRVEDYLANRKGPQPRATGGFRFETTTHPATGTSSFKTASLPSAKMFGQAAADASDNKGLFVSNTSAFGKPATTGFETTVFHSFGDKPFGLTSFGATATDNSLAFGTKPPSGKAAPQSLFGQAKATPAAPAFEATITGFGQPSTSSFSQHSGSTSANGFGKFANALPTTTSIFDSTTTANPRTSIAKYQSNIVTESGLALSVNAKQHCITAMEEYEGKSLSTEDHLTNSKGSQTPAAGGFGFCRTGHSQTSAKMFRQTSSSIKNKDSFVTTIGAFGKTVTMEYGSSASQPFGVKKVGATDTNCFSYNPFGIKPAFGQTQPFCANATDNSKPFATKPAFGQVSPQPLFGEVTPASAAPAFGQITRAFDNGASIPHKPKTGYVADTSQKSLVIFGQIAAGTTENKDTSGFGTFGKAAATTINTTGSVLTLVFGRPTNTEEDGNPEASIVKYQSAINTDAVIMSGQPNNEETKQPVIEELGQPANARVMSNTENSIAKYKPIVGADILLKGPSPNCANIEQPAMKEYKDQSAEEFHMSSEIAEVVCETSIAKYQPTFGSDILMKGALPNSVNTEQPEMKEHEGKSREEGAKCQPTFGTDVLVKDALPNSVNTEQPEIKEHEGKSREEGAKCQPTFGTNLLVKNALPNNVNTEQLDMKEHEGKSREEGAKCQPTFGTDVLVKDALPNSVNTEQPEMKEHEGKSREGGAKCQPTFGTDLVKDDLPNNVNTEQLDLKEHECKSREEGAKCQPTFGTDVLVKDALPNSVNTEQPEMKKHEGKSREEGAKCQPTFVTDVLVKDALPNSVNTEQPEMKEHEGKSREEGAKCQPTFGTDFLVKGDLPNNVNTEQLDMKEHERKSREEGAKCQSTFSSDVLLKDDLSNNVTTEQQLDIKEHEGKSREEGAKCQPTFVTDVLVKDALSNSVNTEQPEIKEREGKSREEGEKGQPTFGTLSNTEQPEIKKEYEGESKEASAKCQLTYGIDTLSIQ